VFAEDDFDLDHGVLDKFIFGNNVPKTGLFGVSEAEVRSWDRIDFLNHLKNDVDKVLLNLVDIDIELDSITILD
jgi:hypothetical protein